MYNGVNCHHCLTLFYFDVKIPPILLGFTGKIVSLQPNCMTT